MTEWAEMIGVSDRSMAASSTPLMACRVHRYDIPRITIVRKKFGREELLHLLFRSSGLRYPHITCVMQLAYQNLSLSKIFSPNAIS